MKQTSEQNLKLLISYADGTVSCESYRNAVKYPSSFIANLKSTLSLKDEQIDSVVGNIAEHFMPFINGCREYLEEQEYLKELQFTFKESNNNKDRAEKLTTAIVAAVRIGGEYGNFEKAYNDLESALSRMPQDIGKLEDEITKSFGVVEARFQKCIKSFVEFENRKRILLSSMNEHAKGLHIGAMIKIEPQKAPTPIRSIMSDLPASDAPNSGDLGNKLPN